MSLWVNLHHTFIAVFKRIGFCERRTYARLPLACDVHPSAMTDQARLMLGKTVSVLATDLQRFGDPLTPDASSVTPTAYTDNFSFRIRSPVYPSLTVNGLSHYVTFIRMLRTLLSCIYQREGRLLQLLPSPIPSHTLLKEEGVLCLHWKLHLQKRLFFRLFDPKYYPRFWHYWKTWNATDEVEFYRRNKAAKVILSRPPPFPSIIVSCIFWLCRTPPQLKNLTRAMTSCMDSVTFHFPRMDLHRIT